MVYMNVFVGWSACREIAARTARFLEDFFKKIERIKVFCCAELPPGSVWESVLFTKLRTADYGILCVSPDSKPSWLLFEMGALSISTRSPYSIGGEPQPEEEPHIAPLFFGVNPQDCGELFDPLKSYQNSSFKERIDKETVRGILKSINLMAYHMAKSEKEAPILPAYLSTDEFNDNFKQFYGSFETDIARLILANARLISANALRRHISSYQEYMERRTGGTASDQITAATLRIHAKELEDLLREDFEDCVEWRERGEAALTKFRDALNLNAHTLEAAGKLDDWERDVETISLNISVAK